MSFTEQQKITHDLVSELESIRKHFREECAKADALVELFESDSVDQAVLQDFYEQMKSISLGCSDDMAQFAKKIMDESVKLLTSPPPCDFEAFAIGSIAKGEATPFSDLEFIFLIERKNQETVQYFELLAVTTYFIIGNLSETKLSYMAVDELKPWFEDKAKNGFKIDGLLQGAGNIPTGNGSEATRNHFIVTPQELADRYLHTLHNPDRTQSVRGDLTAMMAYTKSLYVHHDKHSEGLLGQFHTMTVSAKINASREEANLEMLKTDAKKFNFLPDHSLGNKGFNADVKKEIYRYPSILLLDISIVTSCIGQTSWDSLELLTQRGFISHDVSESLKLLLAAATYIRLSTYLYHDSQDDRLSLCKTSNSIPDTSGAQHVSSPQTLHAKRWFLPIELFSHLCVSMIPLKKAIAVDNFNPMQLKTLKFNTNTWWSKVTILYYTGRYGEALSLLKQSYPRLTERPVETALEISSTSGSGVHATLWIVSETLFWCHEYRAALLLYKYMTDEKIRDERTRQADCYIQLGEYNTAVNILNTIQDKSSYVHYALGQSYTELSRYEEAEKHLVQFLQMEYNELAEVADTDYYGNPSKLQTNAEQNKETDNSVNLEALSPEERLHVIRNVSQLVAAGLVSLADVYSRWKKYSQAAAYYKKTLQCINELFGEGAVVVEAGKTLNNLGNNYRMTGEYEAAVECYNQALAIYKQLQQCTLDIAYTLENLGILYQDYLKDNNEAESYYRQALDIYTRHDPQHRKISLIQRLLSEMLLDVRQQSASETTAAVTSSTSQTEASTSQTRTTQITSHQLRQTTSRKHRCVIS